MSNQEQSKETRIKLVLNEEHRQTLLQCAQSKISTKWNEWRKKNADVEVFLEGLQLENLTFDHFDFSSVHLDCAIFTGCSFRKASFFKADIRKAVFQGCSFESAVFTHAKLANTTFGRSSMEKAVFRYSNMTSCKLCDSLADADMVGAVLVGSFLQGARLDRACLRKANLKNASIYDASLVGTVLERANLEYAHLQRSDLRNANLTSASLIRAGVHDADLRGAKFDDADLRSANLDHAKIDGETSFWRCFIDSKTSFMGIPLGSVKFTNSARQTIEYCTRRKAWKAWCRNHRISGLFTQLFWWSNDYGISTWRIIITFIAISVVFALFYWIFAVCSPPGIIAHLTCNQNDETLPKYVWPFRSLYFSVVTMTTLGFGDMYAREGSILGHLLLMIQVVLGYLLLGSLITRLAVLFTGSGPEGRPFDDFEEGVTKRIYWPEDT